MVLVDLEQHNTKCRITKVDSGIMIPLWKDYDSDKIKNAKFVYFTTCKPGTTKGPYTHLRRSALLSVLQGKIVYVYKESNQYKEVEINADEKPQQNT